MSAVYLHWTFKGESILLPFVVLDSLGGFALASLVIFVICISERCLKRSQLNNCLATYIF